MMGDKRAFLVVGPESSGSRFVHNLLKASGCHGVEYNWTYPHDSRENEIFRSEDGYAGLTGVEKDIVWHRSVPDGVHSTGLDTRSCDQFPPLAAMLNAIAANGFKVVLVICVRDPYAIMESQLNRSMAGSMRDAFTRIGDAYKWIFAAAGGVDQLIVASYDSLVTHKEAPRVFVELLGREFVPVPCIDATGKYYA